MTKKDFKIMTFDGGGVRGLLTTVLLERLSTLRDGLLTDVSLFAGTSIGGIIALAMAAGMPPADLRKLLLAQATALLTDSARPPGGAKKAHYDSWQLEQTLTQLFGAKTQLGDLPAPVMVVAYQLDSGLSASGAIRRNQPVFFHNLNADSARHTIVDAAMATSAYPVFFPVYKGYIDGGVAVVNPAMSALAMALDPAYADRKLEDITLLSVSTGHGPGHIDSSDGGDWGWEQWSQNYRILTATVGTDGDVVDYQCQQLLRARYHRLDPLLPKSIAFNDVFALPELLQTAMQVNIDDSERWLQAHWQ